MSVSILLERWQSEPTIGGNFAVWQKIPSLEPVWSALPEELHPALVDALHTIGVDKLFSHQYSTWRHVQSDRNVVVSTGTASGKTLCYNLPVLDRLIKDPTTRALYIFPTKALAQDQLQTIRGLIDKLSHGSISEILPASLIPVSVYDGDTATINRPLIRKSSRLVISNPDMLHTGILPHHTLWAEFFGSLQFVILDEIHVYRGIFGSHVANVIRRLKRVANFYGCHPRFILTSATIANPVELAERLIEEEVVLVDQDSSSRGPRNFIIYNPPIINRDLGLRRSAIQESLRLADDLLAYDIQTIMFARSRRSVELILTYLRQHQALSYRLPVERAEPTQTENTIRGYRSGYLPDLRREIEVGLRKGDIRLVVATNALELGIDIGGLGAALLIGYPGTIAATLQQTGRAGRREETSLSVLIASADPLDQFLAHHPEYFLSRAPENALINPDNLLILLSHIRCAAFELPFQVGERFGKVDATQVKDILDYLVAEGVLHASGNRYFWMADLYPSQSLSLRNASPARVTLQVRDQDQTKTLGYVDHESAHWMVHPGAIYLHEAQTYRVEELDLENNEAVLQPVEIDYYTEPRLETAVELLNKQEELILQGGVKAYGEVRVTSQLKGYQKIRWYTQERLSYEELLLPPIDLVTTAYWIALSQDTIDTLRDANLWTNDPNKYGPDWKRQSELARARDTYRCQNCGVLENIRAHDVHHRIPFRTFRDTHGNPSYELANRLDNLITLCHPCHRRAETVVRIRSGLAGLSYVMSHLAPFYLMCDTHDLGVHADARSPLSDGQPCVILYDQVPAGIGFSQRLYEVHGELVKHAHSLVKECPCDDGCPSCVGPAGEAGIGGKAESLALLGKISLS